MEQANQESYVNPKYIDRTPLKGRIRNINLIKIKKGDERLESLESDNVIAFPKPPTVFTTTEYDKFKFLSFNRDINESTVRKLVDLGHHEFQFHLFPIVVNNLFEIIDGQHRLKACELLGCPVYYVITLKTNLQICDVEQVNIAGTQHNANTKVEMLLKADYLPVMEAENLRLKFAPKLKTLDVLRLAHVFKVSSATRNALTKRTITLDHKENAEKLLKFVADIEFEERHQCKFIFSVAGLISTGQETINKIGIDRILKRLKANEARMKKTISKSECYDMLRKVYNYQLKTADKIP